MITPPVNIIILRLFKVILFVCFLWSVPEGYGGPYGPGSSDIGTGILYAIVAFMLLIINATFGPSRYSLDFLIERKWRWWKKIAEIKG
jgi:thiosulfate dehydrogenase (quinone) large subunit